VALSQPSCSLNLTPTAINMGESTADSIIKAIIKFAWPIFGVVALATGMMLFWPSASTLFRLNRVPSWIQDYAGLAFIICVAVLFFLVIGALYKLVSLRGAQAQHKKEIRQLLHNLSHEEEAILREFILSGLDVQNLPYQDPAVVSLRNKRIIFLATNSAFVNGITMEFPHQLPSGVKELINVDMVGLAEAYRLHNEDPNQFQASRPHFRRPRHGYY